MALYSVLYCVCGEDVLQYFGIFNDNCLKIMRKLVNWLYLFRH